MNGLIRKEFDTVASITDESQGLVTAIVNVTAVDDFQKDNMNPGCWEPIIKSMQAGEVDYPATFWGHDFTLPTGKVVHAEELRPGDPRLNSAKVPAGAGGLKVVVKYNLGTSRGRDAFSDVKFGAIKQWSVGFASADGGEHYDRKGIRHISKVGIWPDVSNVVIGASPGTHVMAIKAREGGRSLEDLLGQPLEDIIGNAVEEELFNYAFKTAYIEKVTDAAMENPDVIFAAAASIAARNPRSPEGARARQLMENMRSHAAARRRQTAMAQRVSEIQAEFQRS